MLSQKYLQDTSNLDNGRHFQCKMEIEESAVLILRSTWEEQFKSASHLYIIILKYFLFHFYNPVGIKQGLNFKDSSQCMTQTGLTLYNFYQFPE